MKYTREQAIEAVRDIVAGLVDLNHETLEVLSNEVWTAGMRAHREGTEAIAEIKARQKPVRTP